MLARRKRLAQKVFDKYKDRIGDDGYKLVFNKSRAAAGLCYFHKKTIEISIFFLKSSKIKDTDVEDTVLHEISHAIAGWDAAHGPEWKDVALSLGCSGNVCSEHFLEKHDYRYTLRCGKGCRKYVNRRTKKLMVCSKHRCAYMLQK